jgi:hypothetical protein
MSYRIEWLVATVLIRVSPSAITADTEVAIGDAPVDFSD